ncbi:MAG: hypothetical protein WA958_17530 [Tunicatimonas sp.]
MKKKSIYEEIEYYRLIISGALASPAVLKKLAALGYDRKAILAGQQQLHRMKALQQARESGQNSQKASTRSMRQAYQEAYARYVSHVKLARLIVSSDSQTWNDLQLSGRRRKDLAGWMMQTQAFYRHAPAVAKLLAQRGITSEELAQAKAMVEAVAEARVEQNQRKGDKQVAKVRRDQEREALQEWMSKFIRAARYAFAEDKQQLEALGIVVPS